MTYHNAHAARIDHNGVVQEVIVVPYLDDDDAKITEYCNANGLAGTWLDCSYIGARRKQYPGPGYRYDSERDQFIAPQPFPSWSLDGASDWQPPTPCPTDGFHFWDEAVQQWVTI